MLEIEKPRIETAVLSEDGQYGKFVVEPLERGFGITLSQFFADGEMVELTPDLKSVFDCWVNLTPTQKSAALQMLKAMNSDAKHQEVDK